MQQEYFLLLGTSHWPDTVLRSQIKLSKFI